PRLADPGQTFGSRRLAEFIRPLDSLDDAQVADRKNIGTLQAEDQKHLRCPAADTLHLGQALDDRLVVQSIERINREYSALDATTEVAKVAGLLSTQADAAEFFVRRRRHRGRGRKRLVQRFEPRENRSGCLGRELLADDGADERLEGIRM